MSISARNEKSPLLVSAQAQCGVRPRGGYRIVGGRETLPHSWPWQVRPDATLFRAALTEFNYQKD